MTDTAKNTTTRVSYAIKRPTDDVIRQRIHTYYREHKWPISEIELIQMVHIYKMAFESGETFVRLSEKQRDHKSRSIDH